MTIEIAPTVVRVKRMTFVHLVPQDKWTAAGKYAVKTRLKETRVLRVVTLCSQVINATKTTAFDPPCQACWVEAARAGYELRDLPEAREPRQTDAAKRTLPLFGGK